MTHDTRTLIVTGAGGVGKTTISAATAIRLAGPDCRTVVMTVDPARRLADALDLHELSNTPTPVPGVVGLWASTLDASASWEGVVHRYSEPEVAERLVEPRRNAAYVAHFEVLEDQVQHDVLGPGGARLVGCRDHYIAGTDLEIVPAAAVQKLIVVAVCCR